MKSTKKTVAKKRSIPAQAREKATQTRQQRSLFNRYLASMKGKRVEATQKKIADIDQILSEGTKERRVPKFVSGKRHGTEVKRVPLLPADRARLLARQRDLRTSLPTVGKEKLRGQFLKILPTYAASQGWDRQILLDVGVPLADLEATGLK